MQQNVLWTEILATLSSFHRPTDQQKRHKNRKNECVEGSIHVCECEAIHFAEGLFLSYESIETAAGMRFCQPVSQPIDLCGLCAFIIIFFSPFSYEKNWKTEAAKQRWRFCGGSVWI